MNLPKKLEEFKIESPCDGCKIKGKIDCEYCVDYSYYAINRGYMQKQLIKDQIPYTQALEKIKELEAIEESHRKLNGELRERIKGLEETALTKEEAELIKTHTFISKLSLLLLSDKEKKALKSGIAKLQKIIEKENK